MQQTGQNPTRAVGLGHDTLGGLFSTKNQKKPSKIVVKPVVVSSCPLQPNKERNARNSANSVACGQSVLVTTLLVDTSPPKI